MKLLSFVASALLGIALVNSAFAAEYELELEVDAGKHDRKNVIVSKLIEIPEQFANEWIAGIVTKNKKGNGIEVQTGQLSLPSLLDNAPKPSEGKVVRELSFPLRDLPAGQKQIYSVVFKPEITDPLKGDEFAWHDTPGVSNELRLGEKPVLRYMYEPIDESNGAARERTFKPYHHVYNPAGSAIVTKGPGGLFPHHRGIYYGFMTCVYGNNQRADTWHCRDGAYQSHEGFQATATGPVLGRHVVEIDWHGKKKDVFAKEQREVTVYRLPGGNLIEFASRLKGTNGKIKVDGDPQHAGFQFRAAQEVADKTAKQTYYVRPDGADKPGKFRNWPDNKDHINLPWNALSFVVGDQRYTVAYLDSPNNPKDARFSERNYGRFGSYFVKEVPEGETLDVNYRVWIQDGEMTPEQIAPLSADFVDPPTVTVTKK